MPSLSRITNTFFIGLVNRLGVRPPPPNGFELSSVVQPISIVDTDIAIPVAVGLPSFPTPSTIGESPNPAINTVLADTGALAAGVFNLRVLFSLLEALNDVIIAVQHRDAANVANIWEQRFYHDGGSALPMIFRDVSFTDTFLLNERFRVIVLTATGVGSLYHVNVFVVAR